MNKGKKRMHAVAIRETPPAEMEAIIAGIHAEFHALGEGMTAGEYAAHKERLAAEGSDIFKESERAYVEAYQAKLRGDE